MVRPSGPKMGVDVMGDVIDGRDREIDQEFNDCRIEAEQDLSGMRIGAHGAPCGDEGCAGEGKGGVAGERGVERGFADLPLGIVNDGLPPGGVAELEIEEQERAVGGSFAARWGARSQFPVHGADEGERMLLPAVSGLRHEIDAAAIDVAQRGEREGGGTGHIGCRRMSSKRLRLYTN